VRALFPADPERRRARDRILLALAIVIAVVLVLRAARKSEGVLVRNQEWGARFVDRHDPYDDLRRGGRLHGPYPPSYAIVCAPLSLLPTTPARVVWASSQIAALAALFVLLRRWLARAWPLAEPHASVLFAIGLLVGSRYLLRDMSGGGGNTLYVTTLLWGLELALAGRILAPAMLVALPLALKPNLAPLAIALVLRGRWRAFAAAMAVLALLVWMPGLWFGPAEWIELWTRWLADVRAFAAVDDPTSAVQVPVGFPVDETGMNQSLRAALGRGAELFGGDAGAYGEWARWIARVGSSLGLAAAAWASWRARSSRSEILALLAFLPAALLASPIAWKAHHAVLIVLFALLAAAASESGRRRGLAWFLAGYWVCCGLLSEEVVGRAGKAWLQSASVVTWFTIALLVVTIREVRRADGPDPAATRG